MHIPDGYLGPITYGGFWAAMVPIWSLASRRLRKGLQGAQLPFLAMASAFSLVAMIIALPLPGGTSGHMTGSTLVAILLGPWAATIAISIALAIQALIFGDGGVTAIAANCFNIAFVEAWAGYGIYRFILGIGRRISPQKMPCGPSSSIAENSRLALIGAGLGAYLAVNLGGLIAAVELGIQPLLHVSKSGAPLYFPYSLKVAIPAMMIPHLTFVGLLEAGVTVMVFIFISRANPELIHARRILPLIFGAVLLFGLTADAWAHDFWIEKKGKDLLVVFGHGSERIEFDPAKVKRVKVLDASGKPMEVRKEKQGKSVFLFSAGAPALIFAEIDNGYWSKTIYGWKELPKRSASRVVESLRAFYYSKALLSWNEAVQNPVGEDTFEIVPLKNPWELKAGEPLSIQVLLRGKPLAGLEVEGRDHEKAGKTDKNGMAQVRLLKGAQVISVSHKETLKNDPDADFLSLTASLTFEVIK